MPRARVLLTSLLTLVALSVASCDSESPTALAPPQSPELGLPGRGLLNNLTLMSCTPLVADSATALIGASGGTIDVGPHRLTIPAGALTNDVSITAIAPSDTVSRVQLFPEGLKFNKSATLRLSYGHCSGLGTLLPRRVVYIDEDLDILEALVSVTNVFNQTVSGQLDHFSDYAVAW
jgi:hypothetical protein